MVARRDWTRQWYDYAVDVHELVTSAAVLTELQKDTFPGKQAAISQVASLTPLAITAEVQAIAAEYIKRLLMPSDPTGDALHLALASYYDCDFLLTWNCKHLANANTFDNIARVNGILGLSIPKLVTPLELTAEIPDND